MPKSRALPSLCAAVGIAALTAACASASGPSADAASGDESGAVSAIRSLAVSNPAVYSSTVFRAQSERAAEEGFSGSSVPGTPASIFTGTETFPPGAIGPMAPGSGASGSVAGFAGGG